MPKTQHNDTSLLLGYISLVVLGVVEVLTPYDTLPRRLALLSTNLAALIGVLILQKKLEKHGHHLPHAVLWSLFSAVLFDAVGNFARLYTVISWWDELAHLVGSGAVATSLLTLLHEFRHVTPFGGHRGWTFLFVLGMTSALGVLYEIDEYVGDVLFHTHRATKVFDTADDLLWNLIGTVLVILFFQFALKPKRLSD